MGVKVGVGVSVCVAGAVGEPVGVDVRGLIAFDAPHPAIDGRRKTRRINLLNLIRFLVDLMLNSICSSR